MARVKLTEYRAKSLLTTDYHGVSLQASSLDVDIAKLDPKQKYIIKVDQGIKKRGKQGLLRLNVTRATAKAAVAELTEKGFDRFIAEPMMKHDDSEEQYFSIERVRDGFVVFHSTRGGVDIEDHGDDVTRYDDLKNVPLPEAFLKTVADVMDKEHLSFLEVNPLIVRDGTVTLLDAAVLADSAGMGAASWDDTDIADRRQQTSAEATITELNDNSPASFSFRLLNKDGSIWLLLSGGGASITIADEAANRKKADLIGNYGEYSGGPTGEETQLYTEAVLQQMLQSSAKRKALVIAGGVANFTDVKKTFAGLVAALQKNGPALKKAEVKVFVRRGGPNEAEGLALMEKFLKDNGMLGSVHGSNTVLTTVIDEAIGHVDA